jgi:hypothetical protein
MYIKEYISTNNINYNILSITVNHYNIIYSSTFNMTNFDYTDKNLEKEIESFLKPFKIFINYINKTTNIQINDDVEQVDEIDEVEKDKNEQYMMKRINNPDFQAFLDLKRKIAETLKVYNSPKVGKIAGAILKEIKEEYKDMSIVDRFKKAFELFNSNVLKYEEMIKYVDTVEIATKEDKDFQTFLDLKKYITNKLNVSPNHKVDKIVDIVLREIKEKFKDISSIDMSKEGFELFNSYVSKCKENNDYPFDKYEDEDDDGDNDEEWKLEDFVEWLEEFVDHEEFVNLQKNIEDTFEDAERRPDDVVYITYEILREINDTFKDMSFVDKSKKAIELFNSYVSKYKDENNKDANLNEFLCWLRELEKKDLKKNIANKLRLSYNSRNVNKIADIVLIEIKEKFKDMSFVDISKEAFDLFNSYVLKYEEDEDTYDFVEWLEEQESLRTTKKYREDNPTWEADNAAWAVRVDAGQEEEFNRRWGNTNVKAVVNN